MTAHYADLNPRYGARYERRWAVFTRYAPDDVRQTNLHYVNRKAAECAAAKLTEQERDPMCPETLCEGVGIGDSR